MASLIPKHKNSISHRDYMTKINFAFCGNNISPKFKLDTGASQTLISFDHFNKRQMDVILEHPVEQRVLQDATGNLLPYRKIIVENFEIADGFTIPKIVIGVTNAMKHKALLGFDILSLFSLKYDASINEGFWYILDDAQSWNEKICQRLLNKDLTYIDPNFIATMETEDNTKLPQIQQSNFFK